MSRFRFDWSISVGNLLSIVAVVISVYGAYTKILIQLENHNVRLQYIEQKLSNYDRYAK